MMSSKDLLVTSCQPKRTALMNVIATTRTASAQQSTEHFDVLIAGAGISGDRSRRSRVRFD
jgi:hypothetical protein